MNTELARKPTLLLLLALAAGAVLHFGHTPLWCTGVACAAAAWRWAALQGLLPLPGRWLRLGITLLLLASVLSTFGNFGGLAAGSTMLVAMAAAKLMEARDRRDGVIVAMAVLVLVVAAALYRQDLMRVPAYLGTAWLALAASAALGSSTATLSPRLAFAASARALLLALPLAAMCFVLVPRLPAAFGPAFGSSQGLTGLDDEMAPGSLSELSSSDEIAFRVRFDGSPPPPDARYWRGPVLHDFDGFTWKRVPGQSAVPQATEPLSAPLRYRVMMEPHGRNYLFALDTPASITGLRSIRTFDGQMLALRQINAAIAYDATSHLSVRHVAPLSHIGRRMDTRLSAGRNPRSHALAQSLRSESANDREYAARVLKYFQEAGFQYTLTPPLLQRDSVDDLIFRTRLGFCGHFASAYAMLMRAAGVPARVVTGYLGGTWNPVGGYYVVRQSDAHAWTEVWFEESGWTRIDPTSVVAPDRLQRGLGELLPGTRSTSAALINNTPWLRSLRDSWDAAGTWWQERVVRFGSASQRALFEKLGMADIDWSGLALLLTAGATLWGLLLWWHFRRERHHRADALTALWNQFIAVLHRNGVEVAPHDGPVTILRRASAHWPEAAPEITLLVNDYTRLRFGVDATIDSDALQLLRRHLHRISRAKAGRRPPRKAAATRG